MDRTLIPKSVSTKKLELVERTRRITDEPPRTLHHIFDIEWMRKAYRQMSKVGVPNGREIVVGGLVHDWLPYHLG